MKKKLLSVFGGLLTAASTSLAQAPAVMPEAHVPTAPVILSPTHNAMPCESCGCDCQPQPDCGPRGYVNADYLLWWFDDMSIPAPLVATAPAATLGTVTGATLANPAARVVFGANDVDYNSLHGARLTVGYNLNDNLAVEAGGFWIPRQQENFTIASAGAATAPGIFLPIRAVPLPGNAALAGFGIPGLVTAPVEGGTLVAFPGAAGAVSVTSQVSLWGFEANGIWSGGEVGGLQLGLLAGLRHLSLEERLNIQAAQRIGGFRTATFDTFDTANRFWGGQLGARLGWCGERLSATATAKLALGINEAETSLFGNTLTVAGVGAPVVNVPGGSLTSVTQLGTAQQERFAFVPEVGVNFTYRITDALGLNVGYTALYLSEALRASEQVDRHVGSGLRVNGSPGGNFNAPPVRQTNFDEFWAHGLNVGLSLQF